MTFMNGMTRFMGHLGLKVIEHSPTIMLGAGLICIGVGVYQACKKTLTADKAFKKYDSEIAEIESEDKPETYTPELQKKDKGQATLRLVGSLVKHYAVPGILLIGGVGLIVGSHVILSARYATLLGAYTALQAAYEDEKAKIYSIGKDADGNPVLEEESPTHTLLTDWKGRTLPGPYTAWMDNASVYWDATDAKATIMNIKGAEQEIQRKVDRWGYAYLNDAFRLLGLPKTDTGAICGWRKDGSGIVSFVPPWALDCLSREYQEFVLPDGYVGQQQILLTFNCDGSLYGHLPQYEPPRVVKLKGNTANPVRQLEPELSPSAYTTMVEGELYAVAGA